MLNRVTAFPCRVTFTTPAFNAGKAQGRYRNHANEGLEPNCNGQKLSSNHCETLVIQLDRSRFDRVS